MKKLCFLFLAVSLTFIASNAAALSLDISNFRGETDFFNNSYGTTTFMSAATEITYPSSGTGVFQPYLSLQKTHDEEGMGTDATGQFDNKRMGNPSATDGWTHSITVGDLYQTSLGYEFLIDINEPHNSHSFITLTGLEIYVASAGSGASAAAMSGFGTESDWSSGALGLKAYEMIDNLGNPSVPVSVLMDYSLWQGSGQNVDTLVYVPMDLSGFSSTDYIYTYWKFEGANAGFEEIIVRYNSVPEPPTMFLVGSSLIGLAIFGGRRFFKK